MRLVSVNVSEPREIEYRGQADLKVHGGYDMAVYAYPIEHYPHWDGKLTNYSPAATVRARIGHPL